MIVSFSRRKHRRWWSLVVVTLAWRLLLQLLVGNSIQRYVYSLLCCDFSIEVCVSGSLARVCLLTVYMKSFLELHNPVSLRVDDRFESILFDVSFQLCLLSVSLFSLFPFPCVKDENHTESPGSIFDFFVQLRAANKPSCSQIVRDSTR